MQVILKSCFLALIEGIFFNVSCSLTLGEGKFFDWSCFLGLGPKWRQVLPEKLLFGSRWKQVLREPHSQMNSRYSWAFKNRAHSSTMQSTLKFPVTLGTVRNVLSRAEYLRYPKFKPKLLKRNIDARLKFATSDLLKTNLWKKWSSPMRRNLTLTGQTV